MYGLRLPHQIWFVVRGQNDRVPLGPPNYQTCKRARWRRVVSCLCCKGQAVVRLLYHIVLGTLTPALLPQRKQAPLTPQLSKTRTIRAWIALALARADLAARR
jgi:hypothetical protein